jgi:hypothetical protein
MKSAQNFPKLKNIQKTMSTDSTQADVLRKLGSLNWSLMKANLVDQTEDDDDDRPKTITLGFKKLFQTEKDPGFYLLFTDFKSMWYRHCSAKQAVDEHSVSCLF